MSKSALHPFVMALRDEMRKASREDLPVTAEEVLVLAEVAVALWPTAHGIVEASDVEGSRLQEFAGTFQPPGMAVSDPWVAIRALHHDMRAIGGEFGEERSAQVRKGYGQLAGSAHAVARAIELLFDHHYDGAYETLVAPFLPQLARVLAKDRTLA